MFWGSWSQVREAKRAIERERNRMKKMLASSPDPTATATEVTVGTLRRGTELALVLPPGLGVDEDYPPKATALIAFFMRMTVDPDFEDQMIAWADAHLRELGVMAPTH